LNTVVGSSWIGIDLGLKGGMGHIGNGEIRTQPMPAIDSEYDIDRIREILKGWIKERTLAAIEKPMLHPKSGKQSWQRMGQAGGIFQGVCCCLSIPYVEVHPRTWQKAIHRGIRAANPKKRSVIAGKRLGFPTESEGELEALLIAEWLRRAEESDIRIERRH